MLRSVIAIIMILASVVGFVSYVIPTYQGTADARAEEKEFNQALANARRLEEERDALLADFNNIETESLERLETLLPDNIDNVKLIIELDELATTHGLQLQSIDVADSGDADPAEEAPLLREGIASVQLDFSLLGPYERFVAFVEDVENSLRLIDIQQIQFQAATESTNYQYGLSVQTYWLQ